jgi:hypothetical protein
MVGKIIKSNAILWLCWGIAFLDILRSQYSHIEMRINTNLVILSYMWNIKKVVLIKVECRMLVTRAWRQLGLGRKYGQSRSVGGL